MSDGGDGLRLERGSRCVVLGCGHRLAGDLTPALPVGALVRCVTCRELRHVVAAARAS